MSVDRDKWVGASTGKATITLERGPVSKFATAVTDASPIYQDRRAAADAGFENLPVPPTYFFSGAGYWGRFPEAQPSDAEPAEDPTYAVIGGLMAEHGGMVLHGEQTFEYHRPIVVGETLRSEGKVTDLYEKQAGDRVMTFLVTETEYRDDAGNLVLTSRMNLIHRR